MDAEEYIGKAWAAVEKAGVPESLQEMAFKEALDFLRSPDGGGDVAGGDGSGPPKPRTGKRPATRSAAPAAHGSDSGGVSVDEDTFFAQLAHESGVEENDLRDILNLAQGNKVQVTPPTKNLGSSQSEQAKTITALVAGARYKGLNEKPIDAEEVRREVDRKGAYQRKNYAVHHLGPMKGFNAGSTRNEMLATSKWVDEFAAAVDKAHGRESTPASEAS